MLLSRIVCIGQFRMEKLIYPDFLPDKQQNHGMSAREYAQKLKGVFLPPEKSDAAKIEFERRVQLPQESPDMNFNDKKRIFEVAYQEGIRGQNPISGGRISALRRSPPDGFSVTSRMQKRPKTSSSPTFSDCFPIFNKIPTI